MDTSVEAILKEAYFLEMRGESLYRDAVREDMSPELRDLFDFFAQEEERHAKLLKEQLKNLHSGEPVNLPMSPTAPYSGRFSTKEIAVAVKAAGYEGALVGAALDFERRAYEFYELQAETVTDPVFKTLYTELSRWEKQHMTLFAELDREIRENVWYDNNFWPLD
jgi:rubrerythrin